ncbi:MAG: Mth938-like domain-containing protein [Neisseria sp.]|jgi:uncharacterized protein
MEFQEQAHDGNLSITGYEEGVIEINNEAYSSPICLCGNELIPISEATPAELSADSFSFDITKNPHFQKSLQAGNPEVILVGTGDKQIFLHPKITAALAAQGVGLESMSTQAACRTFMILNSEGRRVWAWLWP